MADSTSNAGHDTQEGLGFVNATDPDAEAIARKRHHLASADPEPERDGTMTGAAHERKYGLEREDGTAEAWRASGVDPYNNGALDTADAPASTENTKAPSAEKKS